MLYLSADIIPTLKQVQDNINNRRRKIGNLNDMDLF